MSWSKNLKKNFRMNSSKSSRNFCQTYLNIYLHLISADNPPWLVDGSIAARMYINSLNDNAPLLEMSAALNFSCLLFIRVISQVVLHYLKRSCTSSLLQLHSIINLENVCFDIAIAGKHNIQKNFNRDCWAKSFSFFKFVFKINKWFGI